MPRKNTPENRAKIRAYQRKWYARKAGNPEWNEKKAAQREAGKKRARASGAYNKERQHQLDHRWRQREWEKRHTRFSEFEKLGLHVFYARQQMNPHFYVVDKYGKMRRENLYEPLPTWD